MVDRVQDAAADIDKPSPWKERRRVEARRRVLALTTVLLLSAPGLSRLTVWQRDGRLRTNAVQSAAAIAEHLSKYYAERGHLPPTLPEDMLEALNKPLAPYPRQDQIQRLGDSHESYVVIVGPRIGMITPGADGCAAVMFEAGDGPRAGRLDVVWISKLEAEKLADERDRLLGR